MEVLSLGHSCYLLEMTPPDGSQPVRILADPWLSDHVVGDLQGRFPRLRLDYQALKGLHGVFISHSHTDHLDPDSLLELWGALSDRPKLLLPESLRYLDGLLREYLDGVELVFLRDRQPTSFHGLTLRGFFNPETGATNEDDVMVFVADNGTEIFVSESDALLPFYDPGGREFVSTLIGGGDAETICFLTTRNEGAATMSMLAARDPEDRRRRLEESLERTYEEIYDIYTPMDDLDADLWQDERVVRLIGGQGICFPQQLGTDWNRVLFPIRLRDRVAMEREVARQSECRHAIEEFVPGETHHLEGGKLVKRATCGFVELLDREEEREFDPDLDLFENFPVAPLRDEERDTERQRHRIASCLNERFLPHLIGARAPPVEHLLAANAGEYRIRVRYGTTKTHQDVEYHLTFSQLTFEEVHPSEKDAAQSEPHEFYWANDVEDSLDGRCDEFSTICRRPLGGSAQRFWCCLGFPYLNNDLVEQKLRFHFERVRKGQPSGEWVLAFYQFMA